MGDLLSEIEPEDSNVLADFIKTYLKLTYERIKQVLGKRPEKIHWMLPTEDFPAKHQIMTKFMGENREKLSIQDSRKMNRVQLCKIAETYELLTNLKDIQRDGHRFKTVVLT